jgi:ABC-2 type transport system ATP-binding protein
MLEVCDLTKTYSGNAVVDHVSFRIRPGETLGYLGPNGAGKSTTVRMLTGLLQPSEGQILFDGRDIYGDLAAFQQRLGYVPEEPHLYGCLSAKEHLQLVGRLRGLPEADVERRSSELLRLFGLWDHRHSPVESYSKGMRQKTVISAALLHNPSLIVLDEPFSGLDVAASMVLRSLLQALSARGKMVLFSSHVLETVERICSRVLILAHGRVVGYDSVERLRDLLQQPSLEGVFAQLSQHIDADGIANEILEVIET